jgi:hypothetical protein
VQALVGLVTGITRVAGQTGVLLGMNAVLELTPRWRAGGAGYALLGETAFAESEAGRSLLRLGYGGVFVEWTKPTDLPGGTTARLRMLAGAGNAEVRQAPLGFRLESDNFVVLEPGAALERALARRFSLAVSGGYRLALSVDDLGGLDAGDLGGAILALELRLGPF